MKVWFYNFSKRVNSTLQPSSTYTEYDCKLKENTSVMNPVIQVKATTFTYNYAYISTFGRYYFVSDIVNVTNDITEYYLSEDVMASNKTAIGDTKAMVAYSSSNYHTNVVDPRIITKTKIFESKVLGGSTAFDVTLQGCYVLTTMSKGGGAAGIGNVYVLTAAELAAFANLLNDTSLATALIQYFDGQMKNSILSLIWVPFMITSLGASFYTAVDTIELGPDDTKDITGVAITAKKLTSFANYKASHTMTIHQKYAKTDFRAVEPYTSGCLWLPGIGLVSLSMSDLAESDSVKVESVAEYPTGCVQYDVLTESGNLIQTLRGNVAASCPLGQITVDGAGIMNGIKTAVAGAAAVLTGGSSVAVGAGATAMLFGAGSAMAAYNQRATSISGSVSGRYFNPAWGQVSYLEFAKDTTDPTAADYIARKGRPLGEVVQINTLSGYVECDGASVAADASIDELERMNDIMNKGFFYA